MPMHFLRHQTASPCPHSVSFGNTLNPQYSFFSLAYSFQSLAVDTNYLIPKHFLFNCEK
uniref:Uncharacterized protein n=1 Tax=Manihot esculenta TaxID=3983 RepID=A0A2C9VE60_MANES